MHDLTQLSEGSLPFVESPFRNLGSHPTDLTGLGFRDDLNPEPYPGPYKAFLFSGSLV